MQMIRLINLSLELFGALLSLVIACSLLIIRNTGKGSLSHAVPCHSDLQLFFAVERCSRMGL